MISYSPTIALTLFFAIILVIYLLFKPITGWFWIIKKNQSKNEKIIIEDILKLLFHQENEQKTSSVIQISKAINAPSNSIIDLLNKMSAKQFISLQGDQLKLEPLGREYALKIIRVHRLWEKFLSEKTGFDKSLWHDQAEIKEHQLSATETNKLAERLGHPQFDPHGDPIPNAKGKMANLEGFPLTNLQEGNIGKIIHIEDEPKVIYQQLLAENIHIGSQIRIIENNHTRITFYSEGETIKLAPIVAANITVKMLKKAIYDDKNVKRLSSLKKNEIAQIIGISKESRGENRRRLLDLGFVKGAIVKINLNNPLGDPNAYLIKGTSIALRKKLANKILIKELNQNEN
ncbi:MAG: metal-dependent transcriptional regulator [Lutibacter sp.]